MRLWIAAFLRCLPLDALRPHWPLEGQAFAVLEQERVAALTPAARRAGVKPGMRRAGAAAIAPEGELLPRDAQAESEALQGAALALLQYTPEIALADGDTLLLNVSASLMLFRGPKALHRRVAAPLRALDLHVSLGMAPTAAGAWLLARSSGRRAPRRPLTLPPLTRRLAALPLALLPPAPARRDWLDDIGCHPLADLRALPRAGLQRRSAPALLQALDAAYGLAPELHRWVEPPHQFSRRIELTDYVEHTDAVLAVARRLAEQLGGWLSARQLAVRRVVLSMEHERGRHARPPTELELALAQPVWQAPQILHLLREKLARFTLEAPVIAVALLAPDTVEQPAASTTLFPEPGGTPADHARLLDLLVARLGRDQVRHAPPVPDHRPAAANAWGDALSPPQRPAPLPALLDRPVWRLAPPLPLKLSGPRPQSGGQALRLMRGPERIERGWWDPALTVRDYFVAEDAAAARYWIYRERDDEHARWFLHGLYA
ncbi:Y-family DNA polymerase [Achromobacter aegrifaciens]|uniref:Y-family DNA polymerase n=1 Tax=Achromobacter aegrifaciens TaxID=1287736 RepID=UPI000F7415E5|nr:DNA polymerase Y family protein [Achromobacter aegrifaciens]RSE94374.1 DNA polymerase Y family protein [Achromobacter aegrifaciens]